jgi:hypothetical protein
MTRGLVEAIGRRESAGQKDPYRAIGVPNKKGQKAYGKYQVMDFNIPTWTKEILGRAYTIEEFLADHAAQDKVAQTRLAEYKRKTGSDSDAAAMWFSGRTQKNANNAADALGTTTNQYVSDVTNLMKATPQNNAISGGGNVSLNKSRQDKLKENIDAMVKQGGTQEQIQGYIDSIGKSGGGSNQQASGSGYPAPPKETPFVPGTTGLVNDKRKLSEKITDTLGLHGTADTLGTYGANIGNFLNPKTSLDQKIETAKFLPQTNPWDSVKAGGALSATILGPKVGKVGYDLAKPLMTRAVGAGSSYLTRHPVQKKILDYALQGTILGGAINLGK